MERFGDHAHRMVEWVAEYLATAERRPGSGRLNAKALLGTSPPFEPVVMDEADGALFRQLAAPRDSVVEDLAADWLRQMLDLPDSFTGILFETGTSSTFHSLAAARQLADPAVREAGLVGRPRALRIYLTERAQPAVAKAATALGLGLGSLQTIDVDASGAMNAEALREAIHEDWRNGSTPCCVIAMPGVGTGDAMEPIADVCEAEGVWLHVDATEAGALAVVPEKRPHFAGWERADSIVVSPQAWMFVPLDLSVLLTRRADVLHSAFSLVPDYLRPPGVPPPRELLELGFPVGRRLRALELCHTIRSLGVEGITDRVRKLAAAPVHRQPPIAGRTR